MIAPPWFTVPPTGYGGIEWVVSLLADGLARRGHEVTLFASGGSQCKGQLRSKFVVPPSELLGDWLLEAGHVADAYARWREFDVIHDHTQLGVLSGSHLPIPVVHTVHNEITPVLGAYYDRLPRSLQYVCISAHQASMMPGSTNVSVIHNAVDVDRYPFGKGGEYLLFVGRMSRDKGVVDAIEIARRTRRPLLILAKINEPPERLYFQEHVFPATAGVEVEIKAQVSHDEKAAAYGNALATLFPIHWPEPFGLVMAESMAAGTPVIAYPNGAAPEVIEDGRTGFLCQSIQEAVARIEDVRDLDRRYCRERVEAYFGVEKNTLAHEDLYLRLVGAAEPWRQDGTSLAGATGP